MSATERTTILAHEQAILAAEGPYRVSGVYHSNADDAERMARTAARRKAWAKFADTPKPAPRPRVATWLTSHERQQVGVAAGAHLSLVHRDSLADVREAIATGTADAALVSVALLGPTMRHSLVRLVHGLPESLVVGLVADADAAQALAGALLLGQSGVATVIDSRAPGGWTLLRSIFDAQHLPDAFMRSALASVVVDLAGGEDARRGTADAAHETGFVPDGCLRFLRAVFAPDIHSVKQLSARLGVLPSTLMSRFFRAGLPSPKRYLSYARLVRAAHLAESPALSVSAIACQLDASSPQSFGRTVRLVTGLSASHFCRAVNGQAMLDHFRATLIAPYRETLRTFDPLSERLAVRGRGITAVPRDSAGEALATRDVASPSNNGSAA